MRQFFAKMAAKAATSLSTNDAEIAEMLSGIMPIGRSRPVKRGVDGTLAAYSNSPWLYAAARVVSHDVATARWQIFVSRDDKGKAQRAYKLQRAGVRERKEMIHAMLKQGTLEEIERHPLLDLLDAGNDCQTGLSLRQLNQLYLDLAGECFAVKERNQHGMPIRTWPIPPTWIADLPRPEYPFFQIRFQGWQAEVPITEVVHLFHPDPYNPYQRGVGAGKALADEIETDEYAANHTKAFFYNGARPDIIITADGLDRKDTLRMEQSWMGQHQGFFKAFKPRFLNRKIEVHELNASFKDSQVVELRKHERNAILQVFGVPPEVLGIVEKSNRATIDSADYIMARYAIQPRLEFLRCGYQERLVPDFDERIILDYESPVKEDRELQLKAASAAPWSRSIDEWRDLQDLDPLEDDKGKLYMVPAGLVARESHEGMSGMGGGMFGQTQQPPAQEPPIPDEEPEEDTKAVRKDVAFESVTQISDFIEEPEVRQQVLGMYSAVMAQLTQELGEGVMGEIAEQVGRDIEFQVTSRTSNFVSTQTAERVTLINSTTRAALKQTLEEGVLAGEKLPDLEDRVRDVFTDASTRRIRTIAQTESTLIAGFSANEAIKQADLDKRQWITTRDGRERAQHAGMDKQVRAMGEKFVAPNGAMTDHPGGFGIADLDVGCRCAVQAWFEGMETMSPDALETQMNATWLKREVTRSVAEDRIAMVFSEVFSLQASAVIDKLRRENR